ncbi:hypothetical protein [Pseudobacteroides cellulosolvens]|uniref:Uncharacterized protein n=1 Tax=Pseudobacteroides cellulosolvens ATCC 35603 = DSM 2933 TaxID=398512 RepID=A0A0L6JXZ6_9FIRM|nr:hypothetical protein [Pseudobacteroides cellulosolvens]KNY30430.1 hypothetical protein Bccel_5710 [Pseudobacteroides cellulosolvens ATCC 35603 = DSM 2933]
MSKYLNLFFSKLSNNESETNSLDKLIPAISKDLCTVNFVFEDTLHNDNPFSLEIEFKYTEEFTDLLLSSGLILKLSYEHIYKKLNDKKASLQETNYKKQKESDDVISSLVSIFKGHETSLDYESLEVITQLDEAMHFLGRIQNKDFLIKYKKAIEIALNCRVFESTELALNLDIDFDESSDDDSDLAFNIMNCVLNSSNDICKSYSSSKERSCFSEYCKVFINDLCRYLIKYKYNSLDKSRQDIFKDYYTNSPAYSFPIPSSEEAEYMFKSSIESDYRIEHFISTDSESKHYCFKISFVNDYIIERLNLSFLEKRLEEKLQYLIPVFYFTINTSLQWDEGCYRSGPYKINSHYGAKLLSEYIEDILNSYMEKQKQIIKDYIYEKVKKEFN